MPSRYFMLSGAPLSRLTREAANTSPSLPTPNCTGKGPPPCAGEAEAADCFASGTPVTTITGEKPVETLEVGDRVLTYEHGLSTVRWIGSTEVDLSAFNRDLVPIVIEPGAMGKGHPAERVVVSPSHRIFWTGAIAELLFDHPEVLIPARFLVNKTTIRRATEMDRVTYWHFMCDEHEIVYSAGLKSESYHPGTYGMNGLSDAARQELLTLFPEVMSFDPKSAVDTARPTLRYHEVEVLRDLLGTRLHA
ncbi:Hint domain-containing protein [Vannielia litorea]|uniref:Hint domain-containing protein n=1 Tax=Vannielia litorea TaxID=1217970 RepID=UPI0031407CC5|nr:hypothetical protein [Vannielia litorea]